MSLIKVNNDNFDEEVLKESKKVLIDFNADWCGPCRMLGPIIEELSEEKENIKFVSINIDENEELAMNYQVSSIPCIVLIENGKEIDRRVGLLPKEELESFIGE